MPEKMILKLNYTEEDVISAQRIRFLYDGRFKNILILGAVAFLILGVQVVYEWITNKALPGLWYGPFLAVGSVALIIGFFYLINPLIDFRTHPIWRKNFDLFLSDTHLRLTSKSKKPGGFEMEWSQVKRVLENDRVFILLYGPRGQDFFILPKRLWKDPAKVDAFRSVLTLQASPLWIKVK